MRHPYLKPARANYIPKDASLAHEDPAKGIALYVYKIRTGVVGLAFSGKAQKPDWHFRYRDATALGEKVKAWLAGIAKAEEAKAARRAKMNAPHKLKVGDVLKSSWGYEQTNIDYFEVTAIIGKRMVELRELAQMREETAFMQGRCAPKVGSYIGEPIRKMAREDYVKFESFRYAHRIEPKIVAGVPVYGEGHWTAYA